MNEEEYNYLKSLIPIKKIETEKAEKLVALGWSTVAPVVVDMLLWIQDANWPVARIFMPFLSTISDKIIEEIEPVLQTDDAAWKYYCLCVLQEGVYRDWSATMRAQLEKLYHHPTEEEKEWEIPELIAELL